MHVGARVGDSLNCGCGGGREGGSVGCLRLLTMTVHILQVDNQPVAPLK